MMRDAAMLGTWLWKASEGELASIHATLVAGLANGTLRPLIGQELPPKGAPRAYEGVMQPGAYGQIVPMP
jgi:NADPH2:quinone reductase